MTPLQSIELDMYRQVKKVCDLHGIRHYALGGTLIGAVRHGGFIPWDDDIDVGIPRPDYERFLEIAPRELPERLIARTFHDEEGSTHPTFICQVLDTSTLVRLDFASRTRTSPIWLDVFPLDAMPTNSVLRTIHKYRLLYERMKIQFSMYEENVHQHRASRPFYERALMRFREKTNFGADWDTYELMCHIERTLRHYDYEHEEWIVSAFGAYKSKDIYPKSWFDGSVELPFEDTTVTCPVGYDKLLTQIYGDYMTPPPEDQRSQQHCMTIVTLGDKGRNNLEETE